MTRDDTRGWRRQAARRRTSPEPSPACPDPCRFYRRTAAFGLPHLYRGAQARWRRGSYQGLLHRHRGVGPPRQFRSAERPHCAGPVPDRRQRGHLATKSMMPALCSPGMSISSPSRRTSPVVFAGTHNHRARSHRHWIGWRPHSAGSQQRAVHSAPTILTCWPIMAAAALALLLPLRRHGHYRQDR